MIVAGIGCRKGASAREIGVAIRTALSSAGLESDALGLIAAPATKGREPGIAAAATDMGVPLVLVAQADLEAAGPRTTTRSARVAALMGVPSAAEAAALAAGGPAARLLSPRVAVGPATCALATNEGAS
ncbi:MAG TPA: cobalamin biosynthesis protein [Xanthobacteraceae bacterium]|nr:cobalamin biosynthesis protein [Xanthobacteraceae bacterium]